VVEVGNSEELLVEAFSELPFTWLTLQNGGQGIFLLTAQDLGVLR
jgi:ribosomal protein L3 glutamine methyltransferase